MVRTRQGFLELQSNQHSDWSLSQSVYSGLQEDVVSVISAMPWGYDTPPAVSVERGGLNSVTIT